VHPSTRGRRAVAVVVAALATLGLCGGGPATTGSVASSEAAPPAGSETGTAIRHVIVISIDGLRPDAIVRLGAAGAPGIHRLMREGAYTLNARNLIEHTITLPNHAGMVTGQRVKAAAGGTGVSFNTDRGGTIHDTAGRYMFSVFDVVHDAGGSTGMYVGKDKFDFLDRSWDAVHGAPDTTGADDGRDKIDEYVVGHPEQALVERLSSGSLFAFSFLHLRQPDSAGHHHGWMSAKYLAAVTSADHAVGAVLDAIDASPERTADTAIVLTADHGGRGTHHGTVTRPENYTVPFIVWGPGVPAGADLYALNPGTRLDPGTGRPGYDGVQPIRNGEVANLALDLLELPAIPGSLFDARQDLEVLPADPSRLLP
jgi:hypothetical protein